MIMTSLLCEVGWPALWLGLPGAPALLHTALVRQAADLGNYVSRAGHRARSLQITQGSIDPHPVGDHVHACDHDHVATRKRPI